MRMILTGAVVVILGLSCSGRADPPAPQPVPTPPPPPTVTSTAIPEPSPTAIPTVPPSPSPESTTVAPTVPPTAPAVPDPTVTATSVPETPTPEPVAADPEDVENLRALSDAYWAAFNSYDADAVVGMYEDAYREAREEEVRSDIQLMRMFGVELGVTQEAPPVLTAPNVGELYVNVANPLGVRRVHMVFHKLDSEWKIVHAEDAAP